MVLSAVGDLIRKIAYDKDRKTAADRLYVSGGLAVVGLSNWNDGVLARRTFQAVDLGTGESVGLYTPSAEIGPVDVCFERNSGLTFLRREKNKQSLLVVPLR